MNSQLNLSDPKRAIAYLRTASTIRTCAQQVYAQAQNNELIHFSINEKKIPELAQFVIDVIKEHYPTLDVPYHSRWRHFNCAHRDRLGELDQRLASSTPLERGRALYELVIVSVLLDAGAGEKWTFFDTQSGHRYGRSEGLAIASYEMFAQGLFAHDRQPFCVDFVGLSSLSEESLKRGFQVSDSNPLEGLKGRLHLLQSLAQVLRGRADIFSNSDNPRLGLLFDYFFKDNRKPSEIEAAKILATVLDLFSSIWPGRLFVGDTNLGDVWAFEGIKGEYGTDNLIPFHKLSQWLSYSLFEPLEQAGLKVVGIHELTGLAEYRNGGLFIDGEVLCLKNDLDLHKAHLPSSRLIIEWRALTLALLEVLAEKIRESLQVSAEQFPLAKILQGGTWTAGRKIAWLKRKSTNPPLMIESDGTVF